jgi:threonine aldolase
VETNIVVVMLRDASRVNEVLGELKTQGVLAVPFGPGAVRFVTHLDVNDDDIDRAIAALKGIKA